MAKKSRGTPGSKKGVPKPLKDKIDQGFRKRLRDAMDYRGFKVNAELARQSQCSRQLIGQYLNDEKSAPNPLILLRIARVLRVSPYWLILNVGTMLDGISEEPRIEPAKKMKIG